MGMGTVQQFKPSNPVFLQRIRQIAADSGRIIITKHAKQRMRQRRISLTQVIECLLKGRVVENAHIDIDGDWTGKIEHQYAGDRISVAVAIDGRQHRGEDMAIVITVIMS